MKNKHLILWLFLFLGVSLAVGIGASMLASKNTLYKGAEELGSAVPAYVGGQASVLTPDYREIIRANEERMRPYAPAVRVQRQTAPAEQSRQGGAAQKAPCGKDQTPVIKNGSVVRCSQNIEK